MTWVQPVTLTGRHVSLVPLAQDHRDDLAAVVAAEGLDRLWYTTVPSAEGMGTEIDRRLGLQEAGTMVPFALLTPEGRAVGMTTYMNIDSANRRVEIGSTWVSGTVQRTGLNTEAKRLLLAHAFEVLTANAVELRTHAMNHQSRRAIERLGAKLDGILRAHMILPNGTLRDTAVYSILGTEWPVVRAHLDWQLEKPRA